MTIPTAPNKRESGDDRKVAIALAARALIVEKGLEGLRTRDIADRVGINIATLHYHVPSKEALIELVTENMIAEFRGQSISRPRAHLPPAEQLEHEFRDFEEMYTDKSDVLVVMSELLERARRDDLIRATILPVLAKWRAILAALFARGVADGSFRPDLDPEPAAQMLIGAMVSFSRGPDPTPSNFERLCAELRRAVRNPSDVRNTHHVH